MLTNYKSLIGVYTIPLLNKQKVRLFEALKNTPMHLVYHPGAQVVIPNVFFYLLSSMNAADKSSVADNCFYSSVSPLLASACTPVGALLLSVKLAEQ